MIRQDPYAVQFAQNQEAAKQASLQRRQVAGQVALDNYMKMWQASGLPIQTFIQNSQEAFTGITGSLGLSPEEGFNLMQSYRNKPSSAMDTAITSKNILSNEGVTREGFDPLTFNQGISGARKPDVLRWQDPEIKADGQLPKTLPEYESKTGDIHEPVLVGQKEAILSKDQVTGLQQLFGADFFDKLKSMFPNKEAEKLPETSSITYPGGGISPDEYNRIYAQTPELEGPKVPQSFVDPGRSGPYNAFPDGKVPSTHPSMYTMPESEKISMYWTNPFYAGPQFDRERERETRMYINRITGSPPPVSSEQRFNEAVAAGPTISSPPPQAAPTGSQKTSAEIRRENEILENEARGLYRQAYPDGKLPNTSSSVYIPPQVQENAQYFNALEQSSGRRDEAAQQGQARAELERNAQVDPTITPTDQLEFITIEEYGLNPEAFQRVPDSNSPSGYLQAAPGLIAIFPRAKPQPQPSYQHPPAPVQAAAPPPPEVPPAPLPSSPPPVPVEPVEAVSPVVPEVPVEVPVEEIPEKPLGKYAGIIPNIEENYAELAKASPGMAQMMGLDNFVQLYNSEALGLSSEDAKNQLDLVKFLHEEKLDWAKLELDKQEFAGLMANRESIAQLGAAKLIQQDIDSGRTYAAVELRAAQQTYTLFTNQLLDMQAYAAENGTDVSPEAVAAISERLGPNHSAEVVYIPKEKGFIGKLLGGQTEGTKTPQLYNSMSPFQQKDWISIITIDGTPVFSPGGGTGNKDYAGLFEEWQNED